MHRGGFYSYLYPTAVVKEALSQIIHETLETTKPSVGGLGKETFQPRHNNGVNKFELAVRSPEGPW